MDTKFNESNQIKASVLKFEKVELKRLDDDLIKSSLTKADIELEDEFFSHFQEYMDRGNVPPLSFPQNAKNLKGMELISDQLNTLQNLSDELNFYLNEIIEVKDID